MKLASLAAVAVAASVVVAPGRLASGSTPPTVAYVGDSTMVQEQPYLPAGFTCLCWPGITINQATQIFGPQLQANPPGVVVVSLGLNDQTQGLAFLETVEGFVDLFPVTTKVIWVKPVVASWAAWPWYVTPNAVTEKDQALDYIASQHTNMVALDWSPLPEWFDKGGAHFTPFGNQVRAEVFGAEVNKAGT